MFLNVTGLSDYFLAYPISIHDSNTKLKWNICKQKCETRTKCSSLKCRTLTSEESGLNRESGNRWHPPDWSSRLEQWSGSANSHITVLYSPLPSPHSFISTILSCASLELPSRDTISTRWVHRGLHCSGFMYSLYVQISKFTYIRVQELGYYHWSLVLCE